MSRGFLGNNTSFMLDAVACALALILPVLAYSIFSVKARRRYARHRGLQVTLGLALLVAVIAFEVELRLRGGWLNIANPPGEPPRLEGERLDFVRTVLWVHLLFAVTTPVLWAITITLALRRYANPPQPGRHSRLHKPLGWWSVADLAATSVTGLAFYYLAFVRR